MLRLATAVLVLLGGFAVMVLEIIGARYLDRYFGGSFYVWISQIGVILMALALGYGIGGALADRFHRAGFLTLPLAVAGVFIFLIPKFTPGLLDAIVMRHPAGTSRPSGRSWIRRSERAGFFPPVLCAGGHFSLHDPPGRQET